MFVENLGRFIHHGYEHEDLEVFLEYIEVFYYDSRRT